MANIKIGSIVAGTGRPCYIIAEIGINHNGSLDIAKRLIDVAVDAGCNAVKFQKRTVEVVYTPEELEKPRENPFGKTNGDLKRGLEFGLFEYHEIHCYCRDRRIDWFASCWDEGSVDFIDQFDPVCYKIASASLTDDDLLRRTRSKGRPIILSTGMSTMDEVAHAVNVLDDCDLALTHTCSTYPSSYDELNLRLIPRLADEFNLPVGYSGHESGITISVCAVAMGACIIERHITLDRSMWGSDQSASLPPAELKQMINEIRTLESAMGDGRKRLLPSELPVQQKLRRIGGMPVLVAS